MGSAVLSLAGFWNRKIEGKIEGKYDLEYREQTKKPFASFRILFGTFVTAAKHLFPGFAIKMFKFFIPPNRPK